jgi:hypothetical protein
VPFKLNLRRCIEVIADLEGSEFSAAVKASLPSIIALIAVGGAVNPKP